MPFSDHFETSGHVDSSDNYLGNSDAVVNTALAAQSNVAVTITRDTTFLFAGVQYVYKAGDNVNVKTTINEILTNGKAAVPQSGG